MRLASYNVENMFVRAKALNMDTWAQGCKILEPVTELNELFEKEAYGPNDKARMLELLRLVGLEKVNQSTFVVLRENHGKLIQRSRFGSSSIVANGRADWIGWVELITELVNEQATRNAAQVVRDVNADVMGFCEVENRSALIQFSNKLLPAVNGPSFDQIMLIDGNDDRGISVGLTARNGYRIGWTRSHVDDRDDRSRRVFSRDCPEYSIWTPGGEIIWVLPNHFKSKGYGTQEQSNRRRESQARRVAEIYTRLKSEKGELVAVIGDFNDSPDSPYLAPLVKETDLKDFSTHPAFQSDGHPGTFGGGSAKEKIDYILLSPKLYDRVAAGGIMRKGSWGSGKSPPKWDVYPEITKPYDAASDHAAVWCELSVN